MKLYPKAFALTLVSSLLFGCGGGGSDSTIPTPPATSSSQVSLSSSIAVSSDSSSSANSSVGFASNFVVGADLGWVSEMEKNDYRFYNAAGEERDAFVLMKELGIAAIRLRVWVNPADGWYNGLQDVVAKAKRAHAQGQSLMIDFHYSDNWADPGKQVVPAAWTGYGITDMQTAVANHTREVLVALRDEGITPLWVQVGNETNDGFLWDLARPSTEPRATTMKNYADLTNAGYDAVKAVFPEAKVIVHLANCHDNANFRWIFDGLKSNGGKFDIIAASSYPTTNPSRTWQSINSDCLVNLNDMVDRYQVPVMLTEIGLPWDHPDAKAVVSDLINKVGQVKNQQGLGVFYWEPLAHKGWRGYTLGAFNDQGRPAAGMDALSEAAAQLAPAK